MVIVELINDKIIKFSMHSEVKERGFVAAWEERVRFKTDAVVNLKQYGLFEVSSIKSIRYA